MISLDDALDDKKNGVFILRDVQCLVTFLFTFVCYFLKFSKWQMARETDN